MAAAPWSVGIPGVQGGSLPVPKALQHLGADLAPSHPQGRGCCRWIRRGKVSGGSTRCQHSPECPWATSPLGGSKAESSQLPWDGEGGAAVMINPPALIVPAGSLFPLGFQLWKMLLFRRPPTHVAPQRERGTAQGKTCGENRGLALVGALGPGSGGALPADGSGAVGSLSPKIRTQERAPAGVEEGGCCSQSTTDLVMLLPGPAAPERRAGHAAKLGPGRVLSWGN